MANDPRIPNVQTASNTPDMTADAIDGSQFRMLNADGQFRNVNEDLIKTFINDPEKIWEASGGRIISTGTTVYTLNVGENFSDYGSILVIYDNHSGTTIEVDDCDLYSVSYPTEYLIVNRQLELYTHNRSKKLTVLSDNTFNISDGDASALGVHAIWGY